MQILTKLIFTFGCVLVLFLFPASIFAEKVLIIDPGHGGNYDGTCGYSGKTTGFCEKDANLLVALQLRNILQTTTDITVKLTRTTDIDFADEGAPSWDTTTDIENCMDVINEFAKGNNDNSILISIHFNQDVNSSNTRGTETYYYDGVNHYNPRYPPDPMQIDYLHDNQRLGNLAHDHILQTLQLKDRELRNDSSYYILRNAQMPGILVELGFMTNPDEEALIKSKSFQQDAAQALANTVIDYFNVYEVFNTNNNKLDTFESIEDVITYIESQDEEVIVFDKNKQVVIDPYAKDEPNKSNRRFFYEYNSLSVFENINKWLYWKRTGFDVHYYRELGDIRHTSP